MAGTTTRYCYDGANRLVRAATDGGGDTWTYSYDDNGNRTETRRNGSVVDTQSPDIADLLDDTGYAFDGDGNTTATPNGRSYTYTGSNQLKQVKYNDG